MQTIGQGEYVTAIVMLMIALLFTQLALQWTNYLINTGREAGEDVLRFKEKLIVVYPYNNNASQVLIVNDWDGSSIVRGYIMLKDNGTFTYIDNNFAIPTGSKIVKTLPKNISSDALRLCIYTQYLNIFCNSTQYLFPGIRLEPGTWYIAPLSIFRNSYVVAIAFNTTIGKWVELPTYIWDINRSWILFYVPQNLSYVWFKEVSSLQIKDTSSWFKEDVLLQDPIITITVCFPKKGCSSITVRPNVKLTTSIVFDGWRIVVANTTTLTYDMNWKVLSMSYGHGDGYPPDPDYTNPGSIYSAQISVSNNWVGVKVNANQYGAYGVFYYGTPSAPIPPPSSAGSWLCGCAQRNNFGDCVAHYICSLSKNTPSNFTTSATLYMSTGSKSNIHDDAGVWWANYWYVYVSVPRQTFTYSITKVYEPNANGIIVLNNGTGIIRIKILQATSKL